MKEFCLHRPPVTFTSDKEPTGTLYGFWCEGNTKVFLQVNELTELSDVPDGRTSDRVGCQ